MVGLFLIPPCGITYLYVMQQTLYKTIGNRSQTVKDNGPTLTHLTERYDETNRTGSKPIRRQYHHGYGTTHRTTNRISARDIAP